MPETLTRSAPAPYHCPLRPSTLGRDPAVSRKVLPPIEPPERRPSVYCRTMDWAPRSQQALGLALTALILLTMFASPVGAYDLLALRQ